MSRIHRIRVAEDVEIECQEDGKGPRPFVLVHGYTGSRDDWREHMAPLAEFGRTLAPDQRGHGGSSNPGDPAGYSLGQLSADLAATLTELEANPCDLLGHSMGGMVALRYVLAHPERTSSLILMDTAAGPLDVPDVARKMMEGVQELVRSAGMKGVMEVIRTTMESGGGMGPPPVSAAGCFDTSFERVRPKLEQMDPEAFVTLGRSLLEEAPVVDRLGEIRCPTTVIVGEADLPFRDAAQILVDGIHGAELVVIPEASHQPQLENPKVWFEAIASHLRRVRPT
ncbi:MAG: alpha/beta hydrolase [Myxococcota bacterium]